MWPMPLCHQNKPEFKEALELLENSTLLSSPKSSATPDVWRPYLTLKFISGTFMKQCLFLWPWRSISSWITTCGISMKWEKISMKPMGNLWRLSTTLWMVMRTSTSSKWQEILGLMSTSEKPFKAILLSTLWELGLQTE